MRIKTGCPCCTCKLSAAVDRLIAEIACRKAWPDKRVHPWRKGRPEQPQLERTPKKRHYTRPTFGPKPCKKCRKDFMPRSGKHQICDDCKYGPAGGDPDLEEERTPLTLQSMPVEKLAKVRLKKSEIPK